MIIWSTGVDDQGQPLAPGSIDPHWKFIQGPGVTRGVTPPRNVYVLDNPNQIYPPPTPDSRWVWSDSSGKAETSPSTDPKDSASIPYVFQQTFLLDVELASHWIEIKGRWSADNWGQLSADLTPGVGLGDISLPPGAVFSNFQTEHVFSIFILGPNPSLPPGWHTLEVWVYNWGAAGGGSDPSVNPAAFNLRGLSWDIHQKNVRQFLPQQAAIDPMALILSDSAYLLWTLAHHPDAPKVAEIQEVLRSMTPEERRAALNKATQLADYGKAFKDAAGSAH